MDDLREILGDEKSRFVSSRRGGGLVLLAGEVRGCTAAVGPGRWGDIR